MPEPHLRAGDDDRELVAAALGKHMAAGRLTLAEYEDRLGRVYTARTYGDLAEFTADLPPLPATRPSTPTPTPTPTPAAAGSCAAPVDCGPGVAPGVVAPWSSWHGQAQHSWRAWLSTSVIVVVIYLATSLGDGDFDFFWPIWVIGPWGAVLLAQRITGGARPHDQSPQLDR